MESLSSPEQDLILHIIDQLISSCDYIIEWNKGVKDASFYPASPMGVQIMAASCMLIESIGEGINKINRINPEFLTSHSPETPWHQIIGLRNHIAHGYLNLDEDIIFDVISNEIPPLRSTLCEIIKMTIN